MLRQHGYSDPNIDTLFKASKTIPSPDEFRNLFLRGEITEEQLNAGYKKYGFNDEEILQLKVYSIPFRHIPI